MEFSLPINSEDTGTNGHLGGARGKGKKAGAGKDQLVEMRFYIPGVATKKETMENGDGGSDAEDDEEQNAASLFYETLIEKAEIGEVAGDTYATFLDVLHLTPRYFLFPSSDFKIINHSPEADSISICMSRHSDFGVRLTTTRFNTRPLKNS